MNKVFRIHVRTMSSSQYPSVLVVGSDMVQALKSYLSRAPAVQVLGVEEVGVIDTENIWVQQPNQNPEWQAYLNKLEKEASKA